MSKKKNAQPDEQPSNPDPSSKTQNDSRVLAFDLRFLEDLTFWVETNRKVALRLLALVEEIRRTPFDGTGKPERLKYQSGNVWSRRLTEKDRIVYLVSDHQIDFLQARYHYDDR